MAKKRNKGRGRGRGFYGGGRGGNMNGRSGGYRFQRDTGPRPVVPEVEFPEGADTTPPEPGSGVLELHPNGYGFLRSLANNLSRERSDPFVPGTMIESSGSARACSSTAWCSTAAASRGRVSRRSWMSTE